MFRGFKFSALHQQMICHLVYIALSFKIHAQERPLILIALMWLFILLIERYFISYKNKTKWDVPIASLVIANSIYLNMEAYGTFYWPFFLAISVALAAKYLLRINGRPIFNPSLIGVLFISAFLPQYGSAAMYAWNNEWIYVAIVFCLGTYITYLAKTILLSYSYIISFLIITFLCSFAVHIFPDTFNFMVPQDAPILLYPLSLFTFGNILFAFHGIGDPSTAPIGTRAKILFGIAMGILDFSLRIAVILVAPFLAYAILLLIFGYFRINEQNYKIS